MTITRIKVMKKRVFKTCTTKMLIHLCIFDLWLTATTSVVKRNHIMWTSAFILLDATEVQLVDSKSSDLPTAEESLGNDATGFLKSCLSGK